MRLKKKFTTMVLDKDIADWEKECEKIADEYAIEFAEWSIDYTYHSSFKVWIKNNNSVAEKWTSKELLEIFKKEKGL